MPCAACSLPRCLAEATASAPLFLALLAVTYCYTAFGNLTIGNFIISQGKTTFLLYINLIAAAIGFPLGYILILKLGVLGLIITSLMTQICITIILLYWIRKHYELTVDWLSSTKILLSSAISAAFTYILISELSFSSLIRLVIGVIFFAFVFLATALLTQTINKYDIENLRGMVSGLGIIGKILTRALNVIEKLMKTSKPNSRSQIH